MRTLVSGVDEFEIAGEAELIRAIRAIAAGESLFSAAVASRVLAYFAQTRPVSSQILPSLTDRSEAIVRARDAGFVA